MGTQISCVVERLSYDETRVFDEYTLRFNKQNEVNFTFAETDNVYVTMYFNQESTSVYYESYESKDMVQAVPGIRIHLSTGREDLGAYFAGYFNVVVYQDNEREIYQFFVKPKNLEYENIVHLRDYVDSFYQGLSDDLSKIHYRQSGSLYESNQLNLYTKYLFLENYLKKLLGYMNQYLKKQYRESTKQKEICTHPMRMSAASVRWMIQKGQEHNQDVRKPNKALVERTRFKTDVEQNQFFKSELMFWNTEVDNVISMLELRRKYLRSEIEKLDERLNVLQNRIDFDNCPYNISNRTVISYKNNNVSLQETKWNMENEYKVLTNSIQSMRHFKTNLEYNLHHTWIQDVSIAKKRPRNLKDLRLRLMMDLKAKYKGESVSPFTQDETMIFAKKGTPKLFETYIYIVLLKILMNDGYVLEENLNILQVLSNQSSVVLQKEDSICRIYYDQLLRRSSDVNLESEYVTINSVHNSPDFIISFEDETGVVRAKVIEVKWRSIRNIYNETDDTKVVDQLKDYFNLGYHKSGKRKTMRGVIDRVICVYPDIDQRVTEIQNDEILAVGLLPDENFEESLGYQTLLNLILNEE